MALHCICTALYNAYAGTTCIGELTWQHGQRLTGQSQCENYSETFPEIRKFQIERISGKMKPCLWIKINDQKGGKGFGKGNMYQNSLIKHQNDNLSHTLMLSQELSAVIIGELMRRL